MCFVGGVEGLSVNDFELGGEIFDMDVSPDVESCLSSSALTLLHRSNQDLSLYIEIGSGYVYMVVPWGRVRPL
jgi:hypothetical protein